MPSRPVIGIPTQTLHAIEGISSALPPSWVMSQRYFHAAMAVGGVPWMIPLVDDDLDTLREIYERLDGVLIPGGVDIDPVNFGEEKRAACGVVDPARDRVELQLARWAAADKKPLLGLCRGLQVINVALGGTLFQDITAEKPGALKHDCFPNEGYRRDHRAHDVALSAGSRLRAAFEAPTIAVNSMHHQGIKVSCAGAAAVRRRARWVDRRHRVVERPLYGRRAVAPRGLRIDRRADAPALREFHRGGEEPAGAALSRVSASTA